MEVRSRAPGKIILSGEHAVVHGFTAVAASIDLYTYVRLTLSPSGTGDELLELNLKDMNLEFSWSCSRLKEILGENFPTLGSQPRPCTSEQLELIASLVGEKSVPEAKIHLCSGIYAFLFLYTSIHGYKPARAVVTSELPLGSGLGSSAAFCVSLCGALLALCDGNSVNSEQKGWLSFEERELELVNKWAFEGERIIHGKPSGIDNTVSTFGNMINFKKGGELTKLKSSTQIKMLVTDTRVGRNTKALVASVSERATNHPQAMSSVFNAVDSISNELALIVESPALNEIDLATKEEKVQELMEMNQGLLQCMGVSHSSIETVLRTTLKYKLPSKLTGAGGGGCVLTLIPSLLSATVTDKVITELESCGFGCFKVQVGGKGLEICYS